MAVWGPPFLELFEKVALPSHLTGETLAEIMPSDDVRYVVYTTAEDASEVVSILNRAKIGSDISIVVKAIDPDEIAKIGSDLIDYPLMSACQNIALKEAAERDAAVAFVLADTIVLRGTIARAIRSVRAGKRAVLVPSLQVDRSTFLPEFLELANGSHLGDSALRNDAIVGLALSHLHPSVKALHVDARRFLSRWPSVIYWPVGNEGLIARAFHMHPVLVRQDNASATINSTLDGSFVGTFCSDFDEVDVITDSRDGGLVSLELESQKSELISEASGPAQRDDIINWAAKFSDSFGIRTFFDHPAEFRTADRTEEAWQEAREKSEEFVSKIMTRLASSSS